MLVGPGLHGAFFVFGAGPGRDGDDRNTGRVRILPQFPDSFKTIHAGHSEIHQDKVGAPRASLIYSLDSVRSYGYFIAAQLEHLGHYVALSWMVFDV